MSTIGSYILSTQARTKEEPNPQIAAGQVLKLIGEKEQRSLVALVSVTGWSQEYVKAIVDDLRKDELVMGTDDDLQLTGSGFKAQFLAAT